MNIYLLSKAQALSFSALLLVACGGSSATGGSAGAANGGTTSSAGAANGGMSHGGTSNGGAGNGGASANNTCAVDSDCVACAYPTAPKQASDCYCASCGNTPLAKTACDHNQAAWQLLCNNPPRPCPAIACIEPPVPTCKNGMCSAATGGATGL